MGWNEIDQSALTEPLGRTPCGCVGWNDCPPGVGNDSAESRTPCGCVGWNTLSITGRPQPGCRTPCGCVGWNWYRPEFDLSLIQSHPVRVRGLELAGMAAQERQAMSHPVRVRGLELPLRVVLAGDVASHPVRVRGLERW